jgi:hypothetical protein
MSEKVPPDNDLMRDDAAQPEPSVWDQRSQRQEEIRETYGAAGLGWFGGFVLIVIGTIFMLQNTGILRPITNWWALFLFLPAAGLLTAALDLHRHNNRQWALISAGPLLGALFLVVLATKFLVEFDFGLLLPLFLIGTGLVLLGSGALSRNQPAGEGK